MHAFQKALSSSPVFQLETDTSDFAISGVLS